MATGAVAIETYAAAVGKTALHIQRYARALQLAPGDLWPSGERRRGGPHKPVHVGVHNLINLMLAHIAAPYTADSGRVVLALRSLPFSSASKHRFEPDGRRDITPILRPEDMPLFPTRATFGETCEALVSAIGEGKLALDQMREFRMRMEIDTYHPVPRFSFIGPGSHEYRVRFLADGPIAATGRMLRKTDGAPARINHTIDAPIDLFIALARAWRDPRIVQRKLGRPRKAPKPALVTA